MTQTCASFNSYRKILGQYLEICPDHFLLGLFQFVIHNHPVIRRFLTMQLIQRY